MSYPRSLRGWFYWTLHKMPFGTKVQVTEKIHGSNARYVFIDGYLYAGSHYQWKKRGDNIWWKAVEACPEIEEWCTQNPGKVLYGEVGPTQKGFRYGCGEGETFFFAFCVHDPETGLWSWAKSARASAASGTTLIAAGASGVFNDIISMVITNKSSTATVVTVTDGTTYYKYAIAGNGGIVINFPSPLPAASAATAWTCGNSATVTCDYIVVFAKNK